MAKLLHVIGSSGNGGAETYFADVVRALKIKTKHEIKVVMRYNKVRAKALRAVGIEPEFLPFGGIFDFKTKRQLKRIIAEFKPDLVQTWLRRASKLCPKGNFVHLGEMGGYYNLKYYKNCDYIVAVTQDIINEHIKAGYPKDRAFYIPTLADDITGEAPLSRAAFSTPDDAFVYLALGRLHPCKGLDTLLNAFAKLADKSAYLWLAGEGELDAQLKQQAKQLGIAERVKFLGWRTNREAVLSAVNCLTLPSCSESFGTVMIEAWAQNIPVIACAAKGPKGLIRNGENGFLIEIDDTPALTNAMKEMAEDAEKRQHIIQTARKEFEEKFTVNAVCQAYNNLYTKLIAQGK